MWYNKWITMCVICLVHQLTWANGGDTNLTLFTNGVAGELIENCDSTLSFLIVTRDSVVTEPISYRIERSGTAENLLDYVSDMPDTITMTTGQQVLSYNIAALQDAMVEPAETIIFNLYEIGNPDSLCSTLRITIRDAMDVRGTIGDNPDLCTPPDLTLIASGGSTYLWSPQDLFINPSQDTVVLRQSYEAPIILTGRGPGCVARDTLILSFNNARFTLELLPSPTICLGDTISLIVHAEDTLDDVQVNPNSILVERMDSIYRLVPTSSTTITVTAKDNTCIYADSVSIFVDQLNQPILIPDTVLCTGASVDLTLPFNNTLQSTFNWSPTEGLNATNIATPTCTPTNTTLYTLITTGTLGACTLSDQVLVSVDRVQLPAVINDTIICDGQAVSLAPPFVNPFNNSFTWTPNTGLNFTTIANPEAKPETTTTYTVTSQGTLGTCHETTNVTITVDQLSSPSIISDTTICLGGSVQLTTAIDNPFQSVYSWVPNNGLNSDTTVSPIATPAVTTTYTRITTSALGQCQEQAEVTIEVLDNRFEYQLIDNDTICLGEQTRAVLSASEDVRGISINPNISASFDGDTISFFPSSATNYNIIVDFDKCTAQIEQIIHVIRPEVDVQVLSPATICIGDSIRVNLDFQSQPLSVTWTPMENVFGLNDSIYIFKPTTTQSYELQVDYGFCNYQETIELTVVDNLFETNFPTDTSICVGQNVTGQLSFNNEPNSIGINPLDGALRFGNNVTLTPTRSTTYDIVADYGACVITRSVTIQVDSLPDLSFLVFPTHTSFCKGETVEIIPSSFEPLNYPNISFNWSPNDDNVISGIDGAGIEFSAQVSQSYLRTVQNGPCSSSSTFDLIVVPSAIDISVTDTSICIGSEVPVTISDSDLTNILWVPPRNISCDNCLDPIMSPTETTLYTVSYSRNTCDYDEQVQINVSNLDTTYFEPLIGCLDSLLQINITDPIFDNSNWDFNTDLSCLSCNNPSVILSQSATYTIRDFDEMCQHVGIQDVHVYPKISATIGLLNTDDIFLGQDVFIGADIEAANAVDINWIINGVPQNNNNIGISFTGDQFRYTIELIVTDIETGCTAEDVLIVTINSIDEIRFPNVFTPNGDGRNEVFRPALAQVLKIKSMKIFNRWGQQVFSSTSTDASWDGRMPNGSDAASDTYIYVVELERPNGIMETHQGDINLLR